MPNGQCHLYNRKDDHLYLALKTTFTYSEYSICMKLERTHYTGGCQRTSMSLLAGPPISMWNASWPKLSFQYILRNLSTQRMVDLLYNSLRPHASCSQSVYSRSLQNNRLESISPVLVNFQSYIRSASFLFGSACRVMTSKAFSSVLSQFSILGEVEYCMYQVLQCRRSVSKRDTWMLWMRHSLSTSIFWSVCTATLHVEDAAQYSMNIEVSTKGSTKVWNSA